jgi:O6-methylguanine-DNA--protein-cysteine methyltransferase
MTTTSQTLGWAGVDTPDGRFTAIFDDDGVVYASGWTDDPAYLHNLVAPSLRGETLVERDGGEVIAAVEAYYAGDLDAPSRIRVRQTSGPFLTAAWAALRQVPAALFVPCHRVVRIGGALGGFRYGLDVKQSLIDREVAAAAA